MNIHNGYTDVLLLLFLLLSRFPFVQLSSSTSSFIQFSLVRFHHTITSSIPFPLFGENYYYYFTTNWLAPLPYYYIPFASRGQTNGAAAAVSFPFFFVFSVFLDEEFSHLHRTTTVQQLDDDDDGTL